MPWGVTAADVWTPNATLQTRVSARQPWGKRYCFWPFSESACRPSVDDVSTDKKTLEVDANGTRD